MAATPVIHHTREIKWLPPRGTKQNDCGLRSYSKWPTPRDLTKMATTQQHHQNGCCSGDIPKMATAQENSPKCPFQGLQYSRKPASRHPITRTVSWPRDHPAKLDIAAVQQEPLPQRLAPPSLLLPRGVLLRPRGGTDAPRSVSAFAAPSTAWLCP